MKEDALDEGPILGLIVHGRGNLKFKLFQRNQKCLLVRIGVAMTGKETMTQKVTGLVRHLNGPLVKTQCNVWGAGNGPRQTPDNVFLVLNPLCPILHNVQKGKDRKGDVMYDIKHYRTNGGWAS